MNTNFVGICGLIGAACVMATAADAAILKVPQQYGTIQAAVNAAQEGDTVRVAPGSFTEHVRIEGKAITLAGAGAAQTSIDGGGTGRVVTVSGTGTGLVTIAGFTLRNGVIRWDALDVGPGQGGAIYAESSNIAIRNNVITGNLGCFGTGIATLEATIVLSRNRIESDLAVPDCGQEVVAIRGILSGESSVIGNVIQNNNATGLYLQAAGKITVSNNIIRNNIANGEFSPFGENGGMGSLYTQLVLTNNLFSGNSGYGVGGAYIGSFDGGVVQVAGNSFVGNRSEVASSALTLAGYTANDFLVQHNRFDETVDRPVIECFWETVIDRTNVIASDPEAALSGACVRTE